MQPTCFGRCVRLGLAITLSFWLLGQASALALIFASPDSEPEDIIPAEFPYWENITQRRYEGPSVIYLGAGWALTARHVGVGDILLEGEVFTPNRRSRHTLLNIDGTGADAIVFQLDPDADLPDLPILPLARVAPLAGEEVLVIGFGRGRGKVIEWQDEGRTRFGFEWSERGSKRWGTNRIASSHELLVQRKASTHAITFVFDQPHSKDTTRHEAQATVGDSGGAIFVQRDGEWQLVGMMTSVSADAATPGHTTTYGDTTLAADISYYRSEILRWARPQCINELDDDADGKIDFPLDPECHAPSDADERATNGLMLGIGNTWTGALIGSCVLGAVLLLLLWRSKQS